MGPDICVLENIKFVILANEYGPHLSGLAHIHLPKRFVQYFPKHLFLGET